MKGMPEVIDVVQKIEKDFSAVGGLQQIIFVACGGSLASSYPARYMLLAETKNLSVSGYTSNEFVYAAPKSVGKNTLVVATSTKGTPETVVALQKANALGAVTLGLTGFADSPIAQNARYALTYHHADEWYTDPSLIHCNSQGTALKLAFQLLKVFEGYVDYEKAMDAFERLPDIYAGAYEAAKPKAARFAMDYQHDTVFNILGCGVNWESAYAGAFCFLQEMQALHCVPCNSGEYFHGAFETCDKDLAIILLKGVGRTRPIDDRAQRFLDQFGGHHFTLDVKEMGIEQLDPAVAEYFSALLLHPLIKQYVTALSNIRMYPMTHRRYMWKFTY